MLKSRRFHWFLIFLAFLTLIFSVQFLLYVVTYLRATEAQSKVHLLVREEAPKGFDEYRASLGVEGWTFHALSTWATLYKDDWKDLLDPALSPADLFKERSAGVWVASVPGTVVTTLFSGHAQLQLETLSAQPNVVTVLGYPRFAKDLRLWFWTWSFISFLAISVSGSMLVSAVMADVSLVMVDHRQELEVRHWLGATRAQIRRPIVRKLLSRAISIVLLALCMNSLCYLWLARRDVIELSWPWLRGFTIVSLSAIGMGICLVWAASRLTFRRMMNQWLS